MDKGHHWLCFLSSYLPHVSYYLREAVSACLRSFYTCLCVYTPLRTHGSSVLKRQSLWKQRPRENCVCVCLRVCVWRRERDERPLLWLHGEWTLLITMKLRSQTFYCRYCRLLPHTHTSSLCLLLFSLAPLLSLPPLSVREGIQCADGASFNKVKCSASVRKISQESRARSFRGDLLRFNLNEGILSSVLSWLQSLLCRVVSSHQGTSDSLSLSLSLSLALSFHSTFCWSLPLVQWLRDACSEWLWTPAVQEVKGEVKHFF